MSERLPVQGNGSGAASGSSPPRWTVGWASLAGVVATAVLVAFGVLVVFMLSKASSADTPDNDWSRLTYVFGSVEAIVFAAAGAIFGTTVQRSNTVRAEQRADSQQQRADAHAEDAAKGRTLAKAVKQSAAAAPGGEVESFGAGASRPAVDLAALAEELFPE